MTTVAAYACSTCGTVFDDRDEVLHHIAGHDREATSLESATVDLESPDNAASVESAPAASPSAAGAQILVATKWARNADLIADAFTLMTAAGLYRDDVDSVLDPTYGKGRWWTKFKPSKFEGVSRADDPLWRFEYLPYDDRQFAGVAFDPPYSGKGGRSTSGVREMDSAYGLVDSPTNVDDLLRMNKAGLAECIRVARRFILLKSMNHVAGGELHCHTRKLVEYADRRGWVVYEDLIHVPTGGRPQPTLGPNGEPRRVLHARQRPSQLTILVPRRLRRGDIHRKAVQ